MPEYVHDPLSRVAMCRELLHLRKKIDAAPPERRTKVEVMAGRSIKAIRNVLLGRSTSMSDELLAPGMAAKTLLKHVKAVKDAPAHEQTAVALYAKAIQASVLVLRNAASQAGAEPLGGGMLMDADKELAALLAGLPGDVDPVIDDCIGRGALGDELRDELAGLAGTMERVKAEQAVVLESLDKLINDGHAEYQRLMNIARALPFESQDRVKAYEQANAYLQTKLRPLDQARAEMFASAHKVGMERSREVGRKITDRVLAASKVSEEEAMQWARAQVITPAAKARLRKIGYPADQVVRDMAEFCRITSGRLKRVRIDSNGSRRANATDIEVHGKVGTINLDSRFDRRVLWHELAHHMEADPVAKATAGRFIRRRSVDGKQHSLKSMTGNAAYRSNEVALNGNFFDPYVGKVYRDGLTEVFSMGVETLSDPALLADRALKDPQTLEFVIGFLVGEQHPLSSAHTDMRDMIAGLNEEHREVSGDRVASLVKSLAAKEELIPDGDHSWFAGNWLFESYLKGLTQIGRFDTGHYLFAGKVKSRTKRMVKGLMLVRNVSGYLERLSLPGDSMEQARAAVSIFRHTGTTPSIQELETETLLQKYAK